MKVEITVNCFLAGTPRESYKLLENSITIEPWLNSPDAP